MWILLCRVTFLPDEYDLLLSDYPLLAAEYPVSNFYRYYTREEATNAKEWLNQTYLDERLIRCDWDIGYSEERQFGRGKSGGQVRDEFRKDFDPDRINPNQNRGGER